MDIGRDRTDRLREARLSPQFATVMCSLRFNRKVHRALSRNARIVYSSYIWIFRKQKTAKDSRINITQITIFGSARMRGRNVSINTKLNPGSNTILLGILLRVSLIVPGRLPCPLVNIELAKKKASSGPSSNQ